METLFNMEIKQTPIRWPLAAKQTAGGLGILESAEMRNMRGLVDTASQARASYKPLDDVFITHELADLDTNDLGLIIDFMQRWGIPYHPARWYSLNFWNDSSNEVKEAIQLTNDLSKQEGTNAISIQEAQLSFNTLQGFVKEVTDFLEGAPAVSEMCLSSINACCIPSTLLYAYPKAGTCGDGVFQTKEGRIIGLQFSNNLYYEFTAPKRTAGGLLMDAACLTNVVCNLLFEYLCTQETEYDRFKCGTCGRWFMHFRHEKTPQPKTDKRPARPPKYCSDTCLRRHKTIVQEAKRKEERATKRSSLKAKQKKGGL